jgi:hypothetical protein
MLGLRLADAEGEAAAAGWDGAVYRAWSDGDDVAVILSSEWDSPREAREFRATLASWIAEGSAPALVLDADGTHVNAGFGSSEAVMPAVASALRSM